MAIGELILEIAQRCCVNVRGLSHRAVYTQAIKGRRGILDHTSAKAEVDHGIDLARAVDRNLVVQLRRPAGAVAVLGANADGARSDRIRTALTFGREHLLRRLPLERLADAASLSPRQFNRVFRRQTGKHPLKPSSTYGSRLQAYVSEMALSQSNL